MEKKNNWQLIDKNTYELNTKKYNFYIRYCDEDKSYILDIFDNNIEDTQKSYINSYVYETFNEAKKEAESYN